MGEIIRPIALGDVEQFRAMGDTVFRERRYMAFVEGFPLDECAAFVARNLRELDGEYDDVHLLGRLL